MNFLEYHDTIIKSLPGLSLTRTYIQGNQDFNYQTTGLITLRSSIHLLENLPYIDKEMQNLKSSWLFQSASSEQKITSQQITEIDYNLNSLKIKLDTFKQIAENSKLFNSSDTILIKIPEINSFDNLSKYANDFKKAVEIPVLDESIGGNVTILSAAEGSIVFYISLGALAGVKLVAGICWAAAVIKKKRAEANIFEQHAKTLELKNNALETIIDAQKVQLKNILESEATSIANKEYKHNEPETIERLKLSITTVAELIDKGVQILPISKDIEIQKSFPDYKNLNLIESTIRQLTNQQN